MILFMLVKIIAAPIYIIGKHLMLFRNLVGDFLSSKILRVFMDDFYERGRRQDCRREILLTFLRRSAWAFLGTGVLLHCVSSFDKEKQLSVDTTNLVSVSPQKSEIDWEQMHIDYYFYKNGPLASFDPRRISDPLEEWTPQPELY